MEINMIFLEQYGTTPKMMIEYLEQFGYISTKKFFNVMEDHEIYHKSCYKWQNGTSNCPPCVIHVEINMIFLEQYGTTPKMMIEYLEQFGYISTKNFFNVMEDHEIYHKSCYTVKWKMEHEKIKF